MEFAVEIRNVGGPEFFGGGTFFFDPVGNFVEDGAATVPEVEILRTTDRKFTVANGAVGGAEEIPGVAILGDGGIVDELDVAFDVDGLGGVWRIVFGFGDAVGRD